MGLWDDGPVVPMQPPIMFEQDEEVFVRVECSARADHRVHQPVFLLLVPPGRVSITREGVQEEDLRLIYPRQASIRFVCDGNRPNRCRNRELARFEIRRAWRILFRQFQRKFVHVNPSGNNV